MKRINTCFGFLLLACVVPLTGIAVEEPNVNSQTTTIEGITVDGNLVVVLRTNDLRILARPLTIEGINGPLTITTSPQGIQMQNTNMSVTGGGKLEIRTQLTITKMDLIRLELVPQQK